MRRIVVGVSLLALTYALGFTAARAEGPGALEDRWPVRAGGPLTIDAGVMLALPAALDTGLSTGVGAGATLGLRRWLRLGVRASGSSSTESSIAWTVTQSELRLRAAADIQHLVGRGSFSLRLGLGPTFVRETRVRNQGARAGLTGSDLQTSAVATLPSLDVNAVVALHIAGPWLVIVSGGPAWSVFDGQVKGGWSTLIGTGWQP